MICPTCVNNQYQHQLI